jgi:hypothetical protein
LAGADFGFTLSYLGTFICAFRLRFSSSFPMCSMFGDLVCVINL